MTLKSPMPKLTPEIERLITSNMHIAYAIAKRTKRPSWMTANELYGAAWQGLRKAAIRYNGGLASFPTYAGWIVRGHISDYLRGCDCDPRGRRQGRVNVHVPLNEATMAPARLENPTRDWFQVTLRGLPRDQRLVLLLRYCEGMTFPEIAACVGVSTSMASKLHCAGLSALREELTDIESEN